MCPNKLRFLGYIKESAWPERQSQQLNQNLRLEINIWTVLRIIQKIPRQEYLMCATKILTLELPFFQMVHPK